VEENMTIPRLNALEAIWETSPPLAVSMSMVAQANGMKVKRQKKQISTAEMVRMVDG
jgi:hypothetical protein